MTNSGITTLKIITFGSQAVGKTSILTQVVNGTFSSTEATLCPDLRLKKYSYDGKTVNLALWDTAGMEKFHSLPSNLYRDLQGAILVYDITNYKTFKELNDWMSALDNYYEGLNHHPIVIVLGNKFDLEDAREVSRKEGSDFAKRHRALFLETSAKTKYGVDTAFDDLVTKIMETPGLWKSNLDSSSIVALQDSPSAKTWFKNCSQC